MKRWQTFIILLVVTVCVGYSIAADSAKVADSRTYLADIKELLQQTWPANRTVNIVCHGHSVPAGYFKTPKVDTFNAYPHLLHKAIKDQYPHAVVNVIVTAIGGENSQSGAKRFAKDVLSHHPDIITIDYGLNDRRLGLAKAKESWVSMIKAAKARGIKVILLTPTADVSAQMNNPDDLLNQHAKQIRKLAAEYNVALVDSLAKFKAYVAKGGKLNDLMSQVNHPNRKGHDIVTADLMKWFRVESK